MPALPRALRAAQHRLATPGRSTRRAGGRRTTPGQRPGRPGSVGPGRALYRYNPQSSSFALLRSNTGFDPILTMTGCQSLYCHDDNLAARSCAPGAERGIARSPTRSLDDIDAGTLPEGARLPPQRDLAYRPGGHGRHREPRLCDRRPARPGRRRGRPRHLCARAGRPVPPAGPGRRRRRGRRADHADRQRAARSELPGAARARPGRGRRARRTGSRSSCPTPPSAASPITAPRRPPGSAGSGSRRHPSRSSSPAAPIRRSSPPSRRSPARASRSWSRR